MEYQRNKARRVVMACMFLVTALIMGALTILRNRIFKLIVYATIFYTAIAIHKKLDLILQKVELISEKYITKTSY